MAHVAPDDSYAREQAITAEAQAAFFREQAKRRLSEADQARAFAQTSTSREERAEHRDRAEHLETMSRHDETIARQIRARSRGDA